MTTEQDKKKRREELKQKRTKKKVKETETEVKKANEAQPDETFVDDVDVVEGDPTLGKLDDIEKEVKETEAEVDKTDFAKEINKKEEKNQLIVLRVFTVIIAVIFIGLLIYLISTLSGVRNYEELDIKVTQQTKEKEKLTKEAAELTEKINVAKEALANKENFEQKEANLNARMKSNIVKEADVNEKVTKLEAMKNEHDEEINKVVDLNNLEAYNPRASEINRKAFNQLNNY